MTSNIPGHHFSPPWQVYVYFKVKPEDKCEIINQCLQLAIGLEKHGVHQRLMERADRGSSSDILHTVMEVYTPNDCKLMPNSNDFLQQLEELTSDWGIHLSQPPLRVTEVFVNVKGR